MVYSRKRRRRIISQEDGESHTTASSNNGPHHTQSLSMNNNNNKAISVYSRRGRTRRRRSRKKADALEVKFEVEGLCVKSSDSPIDFTTVTEMGNGNNNNKEIEASGCCKTVERRHYELRSMVSRRAQSQLSTTAEQIKPEVSTVSDLTQVPTNKVTHRLQSTKSSRRGHRKYLKYSTILRNTGLENCTAIITECGKEDEDYMGDQRKDKITRTLESLYACSIITEDFCVKPWYLKYSTILKDTSYEDGNDKITEYGKDPVVYIEDEDFLGEERKQKVTRSVESLYTCPIATGIFA